MSSKKLLILLLVIQLLFFILLAFGLTMHSFYLNSAQERQEVTNIKTNLSNTLNEYVDYINLTEGKVRQLYSHAELQQLLNFYYHILKMSKNAPAVEEIFCIFGDNHENIINQFGKVAYSSIPIEKFHLLAKKHPHAINYIIENESLYIAQNILENHTAKNCSYLSAKISIKELISHISYKEAGKKLFRIVSSDQQYINKNKDVSYTPVNHQLFIEYPSFDYSTIIKEPAFIETISIIFIFWTLTSFGWVIVVCRQLNDHQRINTTLKKQLIKQENQLIALGSTIKNLELASKLKYEIYETIICCFSSYTSLLEKLKEEQNSERDITHIKINASDIIKKCNNILLPVLEKQNIKLKTRYKVDTYNVSVNIIAFELLIINLLYQSILRTPKNSTITIKLYEKEETVFLTIEDRGYDIEQFSTFPDFPKSIFSLPKEDLLYLSSLFSIKLFFSYDNGTKVKIKLGKNHSKSINNLSEPHNVIPFPKQK